MLVKNYQFSLLTAWDLRKLEGFGILVPLEYKVRTVSKSNNIRL